MIPFVAKCMMDKWWNCCQGYLKLMYQEPVPAGPVLLRDHGQLPDGGRIPWEHPGAPDAEQVQLLPEQLPER